MDLIEKYLGEGKFTVTIEKMSSKYASDVKNKTIETKGFVTKEEAKKFITKAMKKYKLQKHSGHTVNYSDMIELSTNF